PIAAFAPRRPHRGTLGGEPAFPIREASRLLWPPRRIPLAGRESTLMTTGDRDFPGSSQGLFEGFPSPCRASFLAVPRDSRRDKIAFPWDVWRPRTQDTPALALDLPIAWRLLPIPAILECHRGRLCELSARARRLWLVSYFSYHRDGAQPRCAGSALRLKKPGSCWDNPR